MDFLGEAPGCPKTCADVGVAEDETADSLCSIPPSEGCSCSEGYVYSGVVCVPEAECGCLDETGSYRTVRKFQDLKD